jgi:glycosyltransferase involved in cell wall biosynthesis
MTKKRPGVLVVNGPLRPAMGGVATFLSHALPYLVEKGMTVHTVMDRRPDDRTAHSAYEQNGLHIHYCPSSRWLVFLQMMRYIRLWLILLWQSGVRPLVALRSYKSIARWIAVCEKVLQDTDIEFVHAFDYPWVQGWVARYLARKYHRRYFQTTYGEVAPHENELALHDGKSDGYRKLVHDVLSSADLILSCSKHCAREVAYVGVEPENVRVLYHGIDTAVFHPKADDSAIRSRYELGENRIILFVGQMRPRKGPQVLLEAVPLIVRKFPNTLVCYAGPDFGMVANLQARSRELEVSSSVRFLGPVDEVLLPDLYNACDIFVFPTCTPIECLGLSMVQAMACGKPVVGSRINGIPEVVDEGVTGLLVEPNNPSELADSVLALLGDKELRERMGAKGIDRARSMFEQRLLAEELYRIYTVDQ